MSTETQTKSADHHVGEPHGPRFINGIRIAHRRFDILRWIGGTGYVLFTEYRVWNPEDVDELDRYGFPRDDTQTVHMKKDWFWELTEPAPRFSVDPAACDHPRDYIADDSRCVEPSRGHRHPGGPMPSEWRQGALCTLCGASGDELLTDRERHLRREHERCGRPEPSPFHGRTDAV